MKFLTDLSFVAALASAASVDLNKRGNPLEVKIERSGNTGVRASITNTGSSDLKVLKTGSILDTLEVEKSQVFTTGSAKLEFDGIRLMIDTRALTEDNFQVIPAGESVNLEWDVAITHDMSAGGDFDVSTHGGISYAEVDSLELTGVTTFSSNVVHTHVDGAAASKVRRDFHAAMNLNKRFAIQDDCQGGERDATASAIAHCQELSAAAASVASGGDAGKMEEFFKASDGATRDQVAGVFSRAADECSSTTSGARQHCTDIYPGGACQGGVVAYALPSENYVVNCPAYFTFPTTSNGCYDPSQGSVTVHEATHLTHIAGTTDVCYGKACTDGLSREDALRNADSYHLFAQSIFAGC